MKKLLLIFVALTLGVATYGQTVARSVMANTNGVVISPTNFWQQAPFTNATRESLGLGWPALTNTNAATSLLGYDTNGQVVANTGTNVLTFTNSIGFTTNAASETRSNLSLGAFRSPSGWAELLSGDGQVFASFEDTVTLYREISFEGVLAETARANSRINLGLGATWLTNTNVTNFRTAIGLGATNDVEFNSIQTENNIVVQGDLTANAINVEGNGIFLSTNAQAPTRTNLGLGATWLTNTNAANFRTAIGLGATNDVTFGRVFASELSGSFTVGAGGLAFEDNGDADTRTNLGLGAIWLTYTNVTNFRTAIGLGETNTPTFSSVTASDSGDATTLNAYGIQGWDTRISLEERSLWVGDEPVLAWSDNDVLFHVPFGFSDPAILSDVRANLGLEPFNGENGFAVIADEFGNAIINTEDSKVGLNGPFRFLANPATHSAISRTNLGLGATWLTNTNVTNFRSAVGLGWSALTNTNAATSLLGFTTNGQVVANTGTNTLTFENIPQFSWGMNIGSPNQDLLVVTPTSIYNNSLEIHFEERRIDGFQSISAESLVAGGDITIQSPGIWWGSDGSGVNLEELYLSWAGQVRLRWQEEIIEISVPITFTGTNTVAATRTNLGLGATWLTNTNVTNFRSAIGLGWAALTNTSADNFRNAIELSRTNNAYFSGVGVGRSADGYVMQGTAAIANENNGFAFTKSGIPFLTISNLDGGTNGGALIFHGSAGAAITRTNLGLGWPALTNTNAANFRTAIGLGATNDVTFNTFNTVTAGVNGFLQIGNYLAPANTNEGYNTFFRIGIEEDSDRTAQIGYRAGGTNSGRGGFISLDFYGADYLFQLSHDAMVPELWTGAEPVKLVSFGDPIAVHRSLQINSGAATVLKLNNPGTYAVDFLVADESLSAGYDAPQWSVGSDMNGFRVKYGLNNVDWGKVLYLDRDNDGGVARSAMGVAPAPIFKVLTNDFSITNQTNMTVVDGLTISTEAGKAYVVELFPIVSASGLSTSLQIVASNATVYGNWDGQNTGSYSTIPLTDAFSSSPTVARVLLQKFYVIANTNAGSIAFQFSSTVGTNTNTIGAGSYMMAQEVVPTP